jgi:hypothetical protein
MENDPPFIGIAMKVTRFITSMKRNDLLLMGFIVTLTLSIGVLTGYIPSPLLTMAAQHAQILKDHQDNSVSQNELIEIAKLQLYLARENCMHGARTESEKTRCDRQSIREAISDIPNDSVSTIANTKVRL